MMFNSQNVITSCSFTFGGGLKRQILLFFFFDKCHVTINQRRSILRRVLFLSNTVQPAKNNSQRGPGNTIYIQICLCTIWRCLLSHFSPWQARSRSPALTATGLLRTGPISGLTYRPIRMWKNTNARTAPKPSPGCLFCTSMRNLVVV